jgi:hypothetical protein
MTKKAKIGLVVGILAVLLLCCCVASIVSISIFRSIFNTADIVDLATSPGNPNVTLANYNRIQIGMTYQEVVAVFGGPGVRTAQIKLVGNWMEFYSWMDTAGGQATIVFREGCVIQKSEDRLR